MKTKTHIACLIAAAGCFFSITPATAVTNSFFTGTPNRTVVNSNANAVTFQSGDYQFTYTVDGYWAPCSGCPVTGRFFSVFWPTGVQAQAIVAGPLSGKGADITIRRTDGLQFDLWKFTGKLLANTAATGGAFEVMPQVNGEDALNDPLMFDCSGSAGQSFSHAPNLASYDAYKIHLWVDWALTALTLIDTNSTVTPPSPPILAASLVSPGGLKLTWPTNQPGFTLEENTATTTNWVAAGVAVAVSGTNFQAVVPMSGAGKFFRLKSP